MLVKINQILVICFLFLLSADSIQCRRRRNHRKKKNNKYGKIDEFHFKLLIVSFDGMTKRDVDYLNKVYNGQSTFDLVRSIGVSAEMETCFPSKTFASHTRIASVGNDLCLFGNLLCS